MNEKIKDTQSAVRVINELQKLLKSGYNLRFSFQFLETGMISLSVPRGFCLELTNKENKRVEKEFTGKNIVEVVNSFIDFFLEGNKGKITADENNFQYSARFRYENGWIVNNARTGHYSYQDSFDD